MAAGTIGMERSRTAQGTSTNGARPLPRRRTSGLNGRAALGGLLVAVAIVLLFSVGRSTTTMERYVVARRPLAIGAQIAPGDVTTARLHLAPGSLRGRLFDRPSRVVGAVVLAPMAAGELVQASAVVAAGAATPDRQVSVPIEASRALGTRLQPGERVDVVATCGTGADAFTVTVVRAARVVARDLNDGALGDRRGEVVVLAVGSGEEAVAVAHAVAAGQLSLVRVTGVAPDASTDAPYRAPRPAR